MFIERSFSLFLEIDAMKCFSCFLKIFGCLDVFVVCLLQFSADEFRLISGFVDVFNLQI